MNLFHMRDLAYLVYYDLPEKMQMNQSVATMCKLLLKQKAEQNNIHLRQMTEGIYHQILIQDYQNENKRSGLVVYCFSYHDEQMIVFRGSESYDGETNALGWQDWEDNIETIYQQDTLQEKAALRYVSQYTNTMHMTISGHSKGGKLAVYVSLHITDEMLNRVDNVIAFNAPGVSNELKKAKRKRIQSSTYQKKVILMDNEYDIVSALFYPVVKPMFIQSNIKGTDLKNILLAHGLYAYLEDGMHFVKVDQRAKFPSEVHHFFNEVLLRLPPAELRVLSLPFFAYFATDTPLSTVIRYVVSLLHHQEVKQVMASVDKKQTLLGRLNLGNTKRVELMNEALVDQYIKDSSLS